MALKPLYGNRQPYGTFDGLDSELTSWKGGEVCTFAYTSVTGSDKAAKDVFDGYVSNTSKTRPVVTKTLVSGNRPLFLADEGIVGYGTLFGVLVGGTAGSNQSSSTIGPHTASGAGKVTVWDGPGIYAVTLDAVDNNDATGLSKYNATLTGGAALYATAAGLLTPAVGSAFESVVVARFIEFTTDGSLVTTPADLVTGATTFTQAVIRFAPEV